MKSVAEGSLLKLQSGMWAYIPFSGAISKHHDSYRLGICEKPGGTPAKKDESWCSSNVATWYPGCLTVGGRGGSRSGLLTYAGVSASLEIVADPAGGDAVTHARLTVLGMEPSIIDIDTAVGGAGVEGLGAAPWAGGSQPAALRSGGGIPDAVAQASAVIPSGHFVGGGALAALRIAKLGMLGVCGGGADVTSEAAVRFLSALAGATDRATAIQLALSCSAAAVGSPGVAGAGGAAPSIRLIAARSASFASLGLWLDAIPDELLAATVAKLGAIAAAGIITVPAGGSASVLLALATALAPDPTAAPAPAPVATAAPGAAPAPAPVATAAPGAASPAAPAAGAPASVSPRDHLIADLRARLAAAGAPAPAPGPAPTPPLEGLAFLHPPAAGSAPRLSPLELLVGLGGADVARSLATMVGNPNALISVSGVGSAPTADHAAQDFARLLREARLARPADARLLASTSPADLDEAGSRLRIVLRLVEEARAASRHAATEASAPADAPHRSHRPERSVKPIPQGALPERARRACGAHLLNALCGSDAARKAAAYDALADPLAECRRNIELHGAPARGFMLSNRESDGDVAGDVHPAITAAATGLSALIEAALEQPATQARARAVAAKTLTLRGDVQSLDLKWEGLVERFGGVPPQTSHFLTGQIETIESTGRWGSTSGPLAYSDAERTARTFAPLLVTLCHDVGGGPAPVDPTYGLLPLVQATSALQDSERAALMQEVLEKLSDAHHAVRRSADATPADAEAIFLLARSTAIKPLLDISQARRAGAAAAQAAIAALPPHQAGGKRGSDALAGAPGTDGQPGKPGDKKSRGAQQREKKAKEKAEAEQKAAAAAAGTSTAPLAPPAPAPLASGALVQTRVPSAKRLAHPAQGEPGPDTVGAKCTGQGDGCVEMVERLSQRENPDTPVHELPCGWHAMDGECKNLAQGKCKKCAFGATASAATLSAVKAACRADFFAKLPAKSLVRAAA